MAKNPPPCNPPPPPDAGEEALRHERAQIDRVIQAVLDAAGRHGYPEASRFAIRLAMEEAISNAFRHGHAGLDPALPVRVAFHVADDQVEISVEDQGPGFDPDAVPDPTLEGNLEMPSGRGLMLMRAYMAAVTYHPPGNRVTMIYHRPTR